MIAPMTRDREEFTNTTKELIAGRAGYRCAVPSCRRITIGPGSASHQTASIGVACHIFSAAAKGPRGQGGLEPEQLKSHENGFWACANHAKLVDTNDGAAYPAGKLLGWRALHEARICAEMNGIHLPIYWIESLEVRTSPVSPRRGPLFKANQSISLAKVTLLIGNNESGKTALCEWLRSSTEEDVLQRWHSTPLGYTIKIHNPDEHVFEVDSINRSFQFRIDGNLVPFNPLPIVVQTVPEPPPRLKGSRDVDWLATWLNITPQVVRRLAAVLPQRFPGLVASIAIDENGKITARSEPGGFVPSLQQMGGSDRWIVAIAMGALRAEYASVHAPTLLLIDGLYELDSDNKALVLRELETVRFQSIATLVHLDKALARGNWGVTRIRPGNDGALLVDE